KEAFVDEIGNVVVAIEFITDAEVAELLDDLSVLEVNADDLVIVATTFDGGPFDDVIGGGTERVAHVRLFEDFLEARASLTADQKGARRVPWTRLMTSTRPSSIASAMVTR